LADPSRTRQFFGGKFLVKVSRRLKKFGLPIAHPSENVGGPIAQRTRPKTLADPSRTRQFFGGKVSRSLKKFGGKFHAASKSLAGSFTQPQKNVTKYILCHP
jgi:hypothetical protein